MAKICCVLLFLHYEYTHNLLIKIILAYFYLIIFTCKTSVKIDNYGKEI